jgi:hypothetical protein
MKTFLAGAMVAAALFPAAGVANAFCVHDDDGTTLPHYHDGPCHSTPHGSGSVAFTGTANVACFGCGVSAGTADLLVSGVIGDAVLGANPVHATFTVDEQPGACPATGTANGTTTGPVQVDFSWTRLGAFAVVTTRGDIDGAGIAAFTVTSPVGVPCGQAVTAAVVGSIAGT